MTNANKSRQEFLEWTRINFPDVYARMVQAVKMHGLGDIWDTLSQTAEKVLPVLVQAKAQRDIFNAQLKRAQKGLPPLETSQIAPTIRVEADIGQDTRNEFLMKYALPAGIGIAILLSIFLFKKSKRRR